MTDPVWLPSAKRVQEANISRFIRLIQKERDPAVSDYQSLYRFSIDSPRAFWRAVWEFCGVLGTAGERTAINLDRMPGASWFPDASLNFAENLLRYRDDRDALVFVSETGISSQLSYKDLYRQVAGVAASLRQCGVEPGDRVAAYMPNLPETVIAMLATTSIGAIWSSCSPDFGVSGVIDRLGQIEPKVLFCAAAYTYNGKQHDCLDKVREIQARIDSIARIIVTTYVEPNPDLDGLKNAELMASFRDETATEIDFTRLPFDHPVYILYSSGTTGVPKCITHGAGGTLLQLLKELVLHTDIKRDDRLCYYTTCGWMMWNWMVNGLATGATLVLYEGSPFYPGPEAMFDLIDRQAISVFGTGAKTISAWQKSGVKPRATHNLHSLKTILSTGSPLSPESFDYVYSEIKPDLCLSSIAGGTDIVSCFVLGCPLLPVYRGEIQCLGLGMAVQICRDDSSYADINETGELVCVQPFPSMPVFFWGDEDGSKYRAAYFEQYAGIWAHGDFARITEHGGMVIFGRSDATLNPGGVRIGTAEIYRQVESLDEVTESICIGQDWDDDVRVVLFVRLRDGLQLDENLQARIRNVVRENATPRHVPAKIIQVSDIPRTISGKIVELAVRNIVHGRNVKNVDALANPEALELYRELPELQS
ncbi:MAG: acetoacetate--CoA ligase [Xanthomonadales bacterium]|nr:acetoacetate--CoA ligase [Gammaproteobacteria bacterium]NNK04944.1 acetoacetate--CoA ligase [Xanthomonadales bacterium]